MHLVLTIGVGFGVHRFYSLIEERPKFRLQLYIPDEPEIMPRQEQSGMRLKTQSLPMYIRYASEISNGTRLSTAKEINELTVRSDKKTRGFSEKRVDGHNVKGFDFIAIPEINPWISKARNKLVQQKRNNLSPQETLDAARTQLKRLLRRHKKQCTA
ncbi:hypothetical protein RclHR1_12650006 [Rhizophagus clarus]|nr:hypothetical protein RclHR1_12650006 [Rhizophagus clarus]